MLDPLTLLAILVMLPNGTTYQVSPLINNYGVYTYPINYAVIYNHVIGSGTYLMTIAPPGTYYSVNAYGPGSMGLYLTSNTNVLLLILSGQGFSELKSGATVKPLFAYYGQELNATIELPSGEYYIVVINNGSATAQVMLATTRNYSTPIINAPIGIVDYGLTPSQVGYIPYSYTTSEFLGEARILSIGVQPLTNCPPHYRLAPSRSN